VYAEYTKLNASFIAGNSLSASVAKEVSIKEYRYTGKECDDSSGLYYYGARYYAPWLGRWTGCDPSGVADGTNLYAYTRDNPIRLFDPNGTQTQDRTKLPQITSEGFVGKPTGTLQPRELPQGKISKAAGSRNRMSDMPDIPSLMPHGLQLGLDTGSQLGLKINEIKGPKKTEEDKGPKKTEEDKGPKKTEEDKGPKKTEEDKGPTFGTQIQVDISYQGGQTALEGTIQGIKHLDVVKNLNIPIVSSLLGPVNIVHDPSALIQTSKSLTSNDGPTPFIGAQADVFNLRKNKTETHVTVQAGFQSRDFVTQIQEGVESHITDPSPPVGPTVPGISIFVNFIQTVVGPEHVRGLSGNVGVSISW
jgi:RHS repeat-associated protein